MALRDRRVLGDSLFPPLARVNTPPLSLDLSSWADRLRASGTVDTFRPVAYLTPVSLAPKGVPALNAAKGTLVLYGRAKDQRGRLGEFYVTTTDTTNVLKLTLDDKNSNVRYVDDLPQRVTISGPLLAGVYDLLELRRGDFSTGYV